MANYSILELNKHKLKHDINKHVSNIYASVQLLELKTEKKEYVKNLKKEVERLVKNVEEEALDSEYIIKKARIISELKKEVKKELKNAEYEENFEIIDSSCNCLNGLLKKNKVKFDVHKPLKNAINTIFNLKISKYLNSKPKNIFLEINGSGLETALINLVSNAVESIEEKTIQDENYVKLKSELVGDYVHISVEDTGEGIPEQVQKKLNDKDSMTTKPDGHGYGLLNVFEFIKSENGRIEYETRKGKGTTFHLYLPIS